MLGKSVTTGTPLSEIITEIQAKAASQLSELAKKVLMDADKEVFAIQPSDLADVNSRFDEQIKLLFNPLKGETVADDQTEESIDFDNLSLILEEDLDVLVAVEGMVAAARNIFLRSCINFNTRLNSLLEDQQIDESNNPLDPGNIFEAFKASVAPLDMNANRSLSVFRLFNKNIVNELENILSDANQILIDHDILPNLGDEPILSPVKATGRAIPRSVTDQNSTGNFGMTPGDTVENVSYQDRQVANTELFNMMQTLMHSPAASYPAAPSGSAPGDQTLYAPGAVPGAAYGAGPRNYVIPAEMLSPELLRAAAATAPPPPDQAIEVVDQKQLISLLSNIQNTLAHLPRIQPDASQEGAAVNESPNIKESLAEMLQAEEKEGVVNAVDRQSHDVIHLVTMLYEAIWNDDSLPIPIKELIGRTQITIIQVALTDTNFFNQEDHPARALLNEFAAAGIGWSEVENLKEDGLYKTMSSLVQKILSDYDGAEHFFEDLLSEFKTYRAQEVARGRRLEQRIKHAREGKTREEFARKLVTQRVEERILGRVLDPFVNDLLSGSFHQFLVLLVLKEGPGSKAWTQAMNTIDVLLWSVQPHEQQEDRQRLETINPRLCNNLKRALRIASVDKETIDSTLETLQEIQKESFNDLAQADLDLDKILDAEEFVFEGMEEEGGESAADTRVPEQQDVLEEGDEYLDTVDALGVGTWLEFAIEEDQNARCKLAARINAIDKFIFVNRQGVKVLEKNRMGLALEFKQASVRVISDGLLFSRALETVIGNLRETQSELRAAGAYQAEPV